MKSVREDKIHKDQRLNREYAVSFVKAFADQNLEEYREPQRAGKSKGEKIGFSLEKQRAAFLMALYPGALRLQKIADLSKVGAGVLRAWKVQKDFTGACAKANDLLAEAIINTIRAEILRKYTSTFPEIDGQLNGKPTLKIKNLNQIYKNPEELNIIFFLSDILPFLNSSIFLKIVLWLKNNSKTHSPGSLEFTSVLYRIIKSLHVRSEKELRKWYRRPDMLDLQKSLIDSDIDFLIDPEMLQQPREKIEEFATFVKKRISELIEILAS